MLRRQPRLPQLTGPRNGARRRKKQLNGLLPRPTCSYRLPRTLPETPAKVALPQGNCSNLRRGEGSAKGPVNKRLHVGHLAAQQRSSSPEQVTGKPGV